MSKSSQAAFRAQFESMNLTPAERAFVNQPRPSEDRPDDYDPLLPALMGAASWAKRQNHSSIEYVFNALLDVYENPKALADIATAVERAKENH